MKVIGAGLPRTATTTQKLALERLGLGPCYQMRDLMENFEEHLPLCRAPADERDPEAGPREGPGEGPGISHDR